MRGAMPLSQAMQAKIDRLNLVLGEGLSGVRVIRAFDRGAHQRERFDQANLDLTNTAIAVNRLIAFLMPALIVMLNLTSIAIIWFGSHRIDQGTMQVGAMIASLQYAMQILFAVFMVTAMFVMLPRASASAARINEVLDVAPEIVDPATPRPAAARAPTRGHVEFQNVTFQYPGAEEPALTGVSFTAHPGEVTAIIGGTGSGQVDARRPDSALLRRQPGARAGRRRRRPRDDAGRPARADRLRAAEGRAVHRHRGREHPLRPRRRDRRGGAPRGDGRAGDRVRRRDAGDSSRRRSRRAASTSRADRSSGSSIARAIVRKPDVYVFDDSFSALDFATDAKLRAALKSETANATVFVVAQRISTVINADRIVVLDNGRVVGIGTHAELLEKSEIYREIVASQVSLEEVA